MQSTLKIFLLFVTFLIEFCHSQNKSIDSLSKSGELNIKSFGLKWTNEENDINFVIWTELEDIKNNFFLAIGFSNDQLMGDDGVVYCQTSNGKTAVIQAYNNYRRPELLDPHNPAIGLTNTNVKYEDGKFICTFKRKKFISNIKNYFDLNNKKYFILFARGAVENERITYHGPENREPSEKLIDFEANTEISTSTPAITTTNDLLGEYSNGDFELTWKQSSESDEYIDFVFSTKISSVTANYTAFAFSHDQRMGEDCVIACRVNLDNSITIEHHFNPKPSYTRPILLVENDPFIGIKNGSILITDEKLVCSFSRKKSMPEVENYFDINSPNAYYLLTAKGKIDEIGIRKHSLVVYSEDKISFTPFSVPITTPNIIQSSTKIVSNGIAFGEFSSGPFSLKWRDTQDETEFLFETLIISKSSNEPLEAFSAMGFSYDQKMGNDGVVYCKNSQNEPKIVQAYNKERRPIPLDDPVIGLSKANVRFENGKLICSFKRAKYLPDVNNYFDLNNKYFLLLSKGPVKDDGNIDYHGPTTENRLFSAKMIDFQENSIDSFNEAGDTRTSRLKAHACLMVIAWIMCSSIGIIFARYYKFILPNKKWFNLQFWFNVHRPLMVLAVLLTLIAFILILSESNWKWVDSLNKISFAHSIFGIIAICLSILQIPIAMTRPAPTHPKRIIFNYTHRSIGFVAFLFATIAIFLGTLISSVNLGTVGWGIMIGWVVWIVLLPLTLELFEFLLSKNTKNKEDSIPMNGEGTKNLTEKTDNKNLEEVKSLFLVYHLIASFGITIALVVIIAI